MHEPGDAPRAGPDPVARAETLVRRVAGLATAGMLVLSWPLWVGTEDFPRVPFVPAFPQATGATGWVLFAATVASVVASATARNRWRPWFGLSLALLAGLVAQDQHRFQPWVYQYAMTVLFLAALPKGEGLRYSRWWFVALYLHSGLSKLDVSFCNELGPVFLRAVVSPLGVDPSRWEGRRRIAAILAMPAAELALAWALAVPRAKRLGRAGAVGLHAGLIGVLGPTGLGHSTIVLVWNAAVMVEVWVAFGPRVAGWTGSYGRQWRTWPVLGLFWAGVLLPLGERWGYFDAWPSHALYASHVERVAVLLHESDVGNGEGAEGLKAHLSDVGEGPWLGLDLTGWSRSVRGTPVYPQNRACLGLAEALASRYPLPLRVRVVGYGTADRWTGRRWRREAVGPDEIRELGARYRINARPWMGGRRRTFR